MRVMDLARIAFLVSFGFLLFLYGAVVGTYKWFPFPLLQKAQVAVYESLGLGRALLGQPPADFVGPARYSGSGVTRMTAAATPGLTFLTGFFDGGNEVRLIRLDGTIVHRWPLRVLDILPDAEHLEGGKPQTDLNAAVHGSEVLPDGSVIVDFTYVGAAKLSRCGEVEWTLDQTTHHSVSLANGGGFWFPNAHLIEEDPHRFPTLHVPYTEDTIIRVSSDGEVMDEISVLETLDANGLAAMNFPRVTGDITHLNDVEELTPQMAGSFPMFAAGDLLVSLRFPSLVFVMDPATRRIKWYQRGPWRGQHDPDFVRSGVIRIFSNNEDGTASGSLLGGSTIIDVNPATREIKHRYGGVADETMYTFDRGKQETLETGNILVTEARSGRVFEATPSGEIVWEYVNRYESSAALVTGAARYNEDYFDVDDWTCP